MLLNYCSFISKFANFRNGHVSTILQYFLNIFKNICIFSFVSLENYKWAKVADMRRRGFKEKDQQMLVDGCRQQSACGCVAVSQTGKCGLSTIELQTKFCEDLAITKKAPNPNRLVPSSGWKCLLVLSHLRH